MEQRATQTMKAMALLWLGAASLAVLPQVQAAEGTHAATPAQASAPARKVSPYRPVGGDSAKVYYQSVWGVDNLLVRRTAADNLIRFSYRVTDPARAKVLNDRKATPLLFDPKTQAVLHVPVMEKVGPLRQSFTPEAGKTYWMTFSNKGNLVKAGDRVNVIIGSFRAEGLLVE